MSDEPPYKAAALPESVIRARQESAEWEAAALAASQPDLDRALDVARTALDELVLHHAAVVDRTDLDLSFVPGSRVLALWESTAAALGLSRAFADLVGLGYHAQILPTYRAIHEVLGVVWILDDENEDEFLAAWLANDEVRQRKVRAAATRQAKRLREKLVAAGKQDLPGDAGAIMNKLYRPLSDISHGRRAAVRTYISETLRSAATGPHPAAEQRLEHHEMCLLLLEDVVIVVGGALWTLYRGTFYADRIVPLQASVAEAAQRLAIIRVQLSR